MGSMIKKYGFLIIVGLLVFFGLRFCSNNGEKTTYEGSTLIQEQIKNVGKLVVTEGHFSEVYNFKNSKEVFGNLFTSNKKALVIVNAAVTVAYDLSKIEFDLDEKNKVLYIKTIPKEEVTINPELKYYDLQADYFNPFLAEDYNKIQKTVKTMLREKIDDSALLKNAKTRFLSELSKFYILTNSLGWKLQYNEIPIQSSEDLEAIKP